MSLLSDALDKALATVQADALKTLLPVINGFLNNIQSNSSVENQVAQGAAVEAALLAAFPNLEQAVVKDLAAQIQTLINTLATPPAGTTVAGQATS